MDSSSDDFYIGYMPNTPPFLAAWLRPRVQLLIALAALVALILVSAQSPFSKAVFEFGTPTDFTGWITMEPAPSLIVAHPTGDQHSRYLLSIYGKLGADDAVRDFDGQRVTVTGELIYRDDRTMVEIAPDTLQVSTEQSPLPTGEPEDLGENTYVGEIVDSKCFLGVMKPGNLKPHRACATRCISGGVPPVLLVRNEAGDATYLLLTGAQGEAIGPRILDRIAEPVKISGRTLRYDDLLVLRSDPATYTVPD